MKNIFKNIRPLIVSIATAVLWLSSYYHLTLRENYFSYAQRPDPATAHTVPYRIKDITVYLTSRENEKLDDLLMIEIFTGGLLLISTLYKR